MNINALCIPSGITFLEEYVFTSKNTPSTSKRR